MQNLCNFQPDYANFHSQYRKLICANLFIFLLGGLFILIAFLNVVTTELAITNRRVIAKFGLIQRQTIELKVNKVESLSVNQGIIGRVFNFGSIVVVGTGGSNAPIPYIANPMNFRQQVNQFLDDYDDGKIAQQQHKI